MLIIAKKIHVLLMRQWQHDPAPLVMCSYWPGKSEVGDYRCAMPSAASFWRDIAAEDMHDPTTHGLSHSQQLQFCQPCNGKTRIRVAPAAAPAPVRPSVAASLCWRRAIPRPHMHPDMPPPPCTFPEQHRSQSLQRCIYTARHGCCCLRHK